MAFVYTKSKRIESLDTIRGLAALSVLFGHTMGVFDWPNSLASWTRFPVVNMLFDGLSTNVASNRIQRALSHGVLVFLGKISYSVYLLQLVVLLCVLPLLVYGLNRIGIQNTLVLMPLANCIAVLLTVATAAFTYRIVELPSIEFGHWISTFIQRRFLKTPKTPKMPKPAV